MRIPLFSRAAGLEPLFAIVADDLNPVAAASLRDRFGFDPLLLHPAIVMPFHLKNRLYNEAALHVGDPLLGVRVGLTAADKAFRPMNDFANAGNGLSEVVDRATAVLAWHCNVCCARLRRHGDRARWSLDYPDRQGEDVTQHAARPLIQMLMMVLRHGGDASGVIVEFEGLPIAERRRVEALLGVAVQPLAGGFAVTFPAQWLDAPAGTGLPEAIAPSSDYAARPLPKTFAAAVQSVFAMHGENFDFDVDQVSAELGTSRRMLQHGLTDEGASYRDMLRHARIEHACHLLAFSEAPIADIAAQIGYSDQANFHRAFVGVTGQTPGRYRETPRAN
jgi:AraC-like DNA-binding protein